MSSESPSATGAPHSWRDLAFACVANANALISDADLLLAHDRPPRALSLAVLAVEELGKTIQAIAVIVNGGVEEEIRDYDRLAGRHMPKIQAGHLWFAVLDPTVDFGPESLAILQARIERAASRKLDGLYVDRTPSGPRTPCEISVPEASAALDTARSLAALLSKYLAPLSDDLAVEALWTQGPKISGQVLEVIEANATTPAEAMTGIRGYMTAIGLDIGST